MINLLFIFFCLFVFFASETPRLIFLSRINEVFFFYDSVCLTFQKRGLNHFPANFIFELSEV